MPFPKHESLSSAFPARQNKFGGLTFGRRIAFRPSEHVMHRLEKRSVRTEAGGQIVKLILRGSLVLPSTKEVAGGRHNGPRGGRQRLSPLETDERKTRAEEGSPTS